MTRTRTDGANMQRQSVPLLRAQAPIVVPEWKAFTARDSGAVILARRSGIIDSVDSERIIVRVEGEHHPMQLSREVAATFISSPSSSARTRTPASISARL